VGSAQEFHRRRRVNDSRQDRDEFEERYAINARPVTVVLLETAPEGHLSLLRPRSEH